VPVGLVVYGNNIYVVDSGNSRIQEFNSSGTYVTQWGSYGSGIGQFNGPVGLAVDSTGNNVYVVDSGNSRIEKFTSNGTYVTQWGSSGSGIGQFYEPSAVAVYGNNIYVVDNGNARIQEFTSSGTYVTQWGSSGSGNGQFSFFDGQFNYAPSGMAVDGSGNVYVADYNNSRIQKFNSSGTYLTQWGSSGSGNGQFNGPVGLAVYGNNIYVADTYNNLVQVFVTQTASTDIGLRVYDGTATIKVACEPAGILTSKLRISKSGITYGILLVPTSDPSASKIRIQTSTGPMALQKLP